MVKPKTFFEVLDKGLCRWIGGGLKGKNEFCGERPMIPGKPYCEKHHKVAYQKAKQKKDF